MLHIGKGTASTFALAIAFTVVAWGRTAEAQELPPYLWDRGTGVRTSILGSYVRQGELLVYPFFEWYADSDLEYKPSDLGFGLEEDFRGRYRESEGLLFLAYGATSDLALELEAAVVTATLEKAPLDPSAMPARVKESGLGDVEAQIRWRLLRENERRPEVFTYFSTVFPFQKNRRLIGTRDWEYNLGFGVTRGLRWGTLTLRAAAAYSGKFDIGEYAVEYLKRLSPTWRFVGAVEGNQLDELALITEIQWQFHPRAVLKLNNGLGLTPNAVDYAPEVGIMFSF